MAGAHAHRAPKRPLWTRLGISGSAAAVVTGAVVTIGTVTATTAVIAADPAPALEGEELVARTVEASIAATREATVSRSAPRVELLPRATDTLMAIGSLDVYTTGKGKKKTGITIKDNSEVAVTGREVGTRSEVVVDGEVGFVESAWLAPGPAVSGVSTAPCPDGSGIERGLTPRAVKLYRAVCAAFPDLKVYGGRDPHGEHVNGQAIDFMVTGKMGTAIAHWIIAHRDELEVHNVIWQQRYASADTGWAWRQMANRGSITANHFDHVHSRVR